MAAASFPGPCDPCPSGPAGIMPSAPLLAGANPLLIPDVMALVGSSMRTSEIVQFARACKGLQEPLWRGWYESRTGRQVSQWVGASSAAKAHMRHICDTLEELLSTSYRDKNLSYEQLIAEVETHRVGLAARLSSLLLSEEELPDCIRVVLRGTSWNDWNKENLAATISNKTIDEIMPRLDLNRAEERRWVIPILARLGRVEELNTVLSREELNENGRVEAIIQAASCSHSAKMRAIVELLLRGAPLSEAARKRAIDSYATRTKEHLPALQALLEAPGDRSVDCIHGWVKYHAGQCRSPAHLALFLLRSPPNPRLVEEALRAAMHGQICSRLQRDSVKAILSHAYRHGIILPKAVRQELFQELVEDSMSCPSADLLYDPSFDQDFLRTVIRKIAFRDNAPLFKRVLTDLRGLTPGQWAELNSRHERVIRHIEESNPPGSRLHLMDPEAYQRDEERKQARLALHREMHAFLQEHRPNS